VNEASGTGYELLLGEWLVSRSLITRGDLFAALSRSFQRGCRLGDALVDLGLLERGSIELEVTRLCAPAASRSTVAGSRPTSRRPPSIALNAEGVPPLSDRNVPGLYRNKTSRWG
jgi:hypothetical protein